MWSLVNVGRKQSSGVIANAETTRATGSVTLVTGQLRVAVALRSEPILLAVASTIVMTSAIKTVLARGLVTVSLAEEATVGTVIIVETFASTIVSTISTLTASCVGNAVDRARWSVKVGYTLASKSFACAVNARRAVGLTSRNTVYKEEGAGVKSSNERNPKRGSTGVVPSPNFGTILKMESKKSIGVSRSQEVHQTSCVNASYDVVGSHVDWLLPHNGVGTVIQGTEGSSLGINLVGNESFTWTNGQNFG